MVRKNNFLLIGGGAILAAVVTIAVFIPRFTDKGIEPNPSENQSEEARTAHEWLTMENRPEDAEISRRIQNDIVAENDISHYARNVKIVTDKGVVTISGAVLNDHEHQILKGIVSRHVPLQNIRDEVTIASPQTIEEQPPEAEAHLPSEAL